MAMLEIRGVHKSFHTYAKPGVHPGIFGRAPKPTSSLDVLRGVDLTVEKGDVVAILGPSGSGKTTLLRCLNFLETADAGKLTFDGETFDLAHADRASIARLRRKTAFVFQNYNLFRNKTALQNVTEGLIVARRTPKAEADAVGMKMLEKVGLADRADYYPRQLSGGQQQRVAIARALASGPEIQGLTVWMLPVEDGWPLCEHLLPGTPAQFRLGFSGEERYDLGLGFASKSSIVPSAMTCPPLAPRFRPHLDHPVGLFRIGCRGPPEQPSCHRPRSCIHQSSPRCSTDAGRWTAHPAHRARRWCGCGRPGQLHPLALTGGKGRGRAVKRRITQT